MERLVLNYAEWVRRAAAFTESLRGLPGEVRVAVEVAPPLSEEQIEELARSCRLPIPESLRRFWKEASGHCNCTYWWDAPKRFRPQFAVAFPNDSLHPIVGGPKFESATTSVELAEPFLDWSDRFRDEYPKDARFHEHSLPIVPLGNGDYAGVYMRDTPDDPPVVFLCHDGCGASGLIAPNLDTFLTLWERLSYICIDLLMSFINPRTGLLDPDVFPGEKEAVRSLLRGDVRSDIVSTSPFKTGCEWETCTDPELMLKWLDKNGRLDEQTVRRFACACCRRVWDRMGPWSRRAVEVAESFADGLASKAELEDARAALGGGDQGHQLQEEMSISAGAFEILQFDRALKESVKFSQSQGLMHRAAYDAVDGSWLVSGTITQHLDEPELHREKMAHADLVRHFFGNPFR